METSHTWESECLPGLEVRNSAGGDIGLCTLWTPVSRFSPHLDLPRINIIGPLRTRTGLGWLLRGLYLTPAIRNLVICGSDLSMTGDALLSLWEEGITEDNTLPRLGWRLHPEMDREAVDVLRAYVKVHDWRAKSLEEVAREINDIPHLPQEMAPRSFPPVVTPEQNTFPSRKTSFPIFSEDVGDGWLQLLNLTMRCGIVKQTREGNRLAEVLNVMVTIDLTGEEETLPPCFDFGSEELESYYRYFVSPSPPEDVYYTYGQRLQDWTWSHHEANRMERVNQLERTIDRLKRFGDTETGGTMVLLGPTDLDGLDHAPGVVSVTFNIVDGRLYGTYFIQSDDIYNAWPLNALSLVRLQREVSRRTGVPVDSATFISQSAHVYDRDWGKAWAKLDEWFKRPLPLQPDCSGLFFFGVQDDMARALLVSPEADMVLWEHESSDPEELVRYIVDTMPWLAAQHIRYLGQEAARLGRALSEGVDYEQG